MQGVELVGGGAFVDKKALAYSFSTLTLRLSPPHSLSLPPSPPLATSINQGDGVISPVIRREEGGGRREEGRCDQAVLPNRLHTLSFGGSLSQWGSCLETTQSPISDLARGKPRHVAKNGGRKKFKFKIFILRTQNYKPTENKTSLQFCFLGNQTGQAPLIKQTIHRLSPPKKNYTCIICRYLKKKIKKIRSEHSIHGYHLRCVGLIEHILELHVKYFVIFAEILKNKTTKNTLGTQHSWVSFKTFWSNRAYSWIKRKIFCII